MVLWHNNDRKLEKHLRSVFLVSNNSPLSPAAFSELKAVIKGIEKEKAAEVKKTEGVENNEEIKKAKAGENENAREIEKTLRNKKKQGSMGEDADQGKSASFLYNTNAKKLIFHGKNYKILPLFLAVRDLYASLPFFEELQACAERLEKDPQDATALFQKAVLMYKARRFETALQLTGKILKIIPDDHRVWYNRGVILVELGLLEEALAAYDTFDNFEC